MRGSAVALWKHVGQLAGVRDVQTLPPHRPRGRGGKDGRVMSVIITDTVQGVIDAQGRAQVAHLAAEASRFTTEPGTIHPSVSIVCNPMMSERCEVVTPGAQCTCYPLRVWDRREFDALVEYRHGIQ